MRYLPDHVTQEDGSTCQWTNCGMAVGSWLADGASGGERKPEPTYFRFKAQAQDCRPTGLGDLQRGLQNMGLWGRCRYTPDVSRVSLRRRLLADTDLLVAMETDFESWPESVICQADFNDRPDAYHAIGVVCGGRDGKVRVMDPLCDRYKWVDLDEVIQAAVTYNDEHSGEQRGTVDIITVTPPKV